MGETKFQQVSMTHKHESLLWHSLMLLCLCCSSTQVGGFLASGRQHHPPVSFSPPTARTDTYRQVVPHEHYFGGSSRKSAENTTEFVKALAIVPPTKLWDRLQRARHYARDPLFHEWPPAVRLFHPFSSTALDVAQVVDELELEPFEITLDSWVIVPHLEVIQAQWASAQNAAHVEDATDIGVNPYEEEDRAVQELIASEERKGQEKYRARQLKEQAQSGSKPKTAVKEEAPWEEKKSPAQVLQEQTKAYEEVGGPCILCLEPDEESKERLCELREALAEVLDHDAYSSPSSAYSWSFVSEEMDTGYRPLIPISSFESIQSALDIARRLKGIWGEPLTWQVKDMHVISCLGVEDEDWEGTSPQSSMEWNKMPWGCSAKVMLMGEELEQDEEFNMAMVQRLVEEGEPGGMDISMDYTILEDEEEEPLSNIEQWLNDDEDFDEGTRVVIGRTEFLTGDQRVYTGMPASSVTDAKDRAMGDVGVVSAVARRRRTTSRQGNMWEEGEFGRRDIDYLPWNMRERTGKLAKQDEASERLANQETLNEFYNAQSEEE